MSYGGALTHFSCKLGLKKIFFTALGGAPPGYTPMSGNNSSNRSLMKRSSSGVSVFEPAFKHAEDISNINFRHAYCLIFFSVTHFIITVYMAAPFAIVDTSFF